MYIIFSAKLLLTNWNFLNFSCFSSKMNLTSIGTKAYHLEQLGAPIPKKMSENLLFDLILNCFYVTEGSGPDMLNKNSFKKDAILDFAS